MIVSSVGKTAHRLHLPAFIISFAILGFLTSTPEIAVGLNSISGETPSIFVGNLLGGVPVLFFLLIPLFAIFNGGIKLSHGFGHKSMALSFIATIAPFFTVLDGKITQNEGSVLIILYLFTVFALYVANKPSNKNINLLNIKSYSFLDIIKVVIGTIIVLFSSNFIVDKTIYFSNLLKISPFYISIVIISFGTNLPEIMVSLKSLIMKKKDIALGNYLGSASANSCLFGIFAVMSGEGDIVISDNFTWLFVIIITGVITLYHFARTKNRLSVKEGFLMLLFYIAFVYLELLKKMYLYI